MSTYQWIINEMIPALSRTLLHSLWLGIIAAVLAGLIMIATKKTAASVRYNLLLSLFAMLIVSTGVTFINELKSYGYSSSFASTQVVEKPEPITITGENRSIISENNNYFASFLSFVNQNALFIISAWFLLFMFRIIKMGIGLKHIHMVRNKKTCPASNQWTEWIREQSEQMGIGQSIIFLQSELIKVPIAIGYLKPMILVPLGLLSQLSPQQVETVLLHELAHIKRKDYIVNLLQTMVDAIFFFNPAFAWISSLIRQERENCCDDIVIAQTNNQGDYLEALMCFQSGNILKTYAMALGTRKQSLLQRVKRMLTRENSNLTTKEIFTLLSGLLIAAFCFMAFQPKQQFANVAAIPFQQSSLQYSIIKVEQPVIELISRDLIKQESPVNSVILKSDTIPGKIGKIKIKNLKTEKQKEKSGFKQIISNISDDGTNSVQQIQATTHDGNVYKIRRVGGEILSFTINGKEIAKEDYNKKYNEVIRAINHESQKRSKEAMKAQQRKQQEFKAKQSRLASKQGKIKFRGNIKMDSSNKGRINLNLNNKLLSQRTLKLSTITMSSNSTLNAIIRELISSKIADDETNLSFTLNNSQFIVNGMVQPQTVFEKFKTKYLKSSEDRFRYSRAGGNISTDIYIK